MKHKITLIFLLVSLAAFSGFSQSLTIKGAVVRGGENSPIEFATVMLLERDTETKIKGTTSDQEGRFSIQTETNDFWVQISFIGFQTKTLKEFTPENGLIDLGQIELVENDLTLDEVVIAGEKSSMEFKLDKRVFNVGKDLSSTGASALEVLNNVPSVNVNIEGQISLRGSQGVQVLINGKPSVIASEQGNALGTITADMIEKVEVITNPSAKYEAEGTSGIINIVLKKDEKKGVNGSFTINTGVPHNHSFGLSLNRRTEKFNLFTQLGVGYRELPNQNESINRNLLTGTTISSEGMEFRNENFYNVILGADYYINPRNVITLSGNFAYEIEDQPSETDFQLTDSLGTIQSVWNRTEVTEATNPKYQYELQYKSDFEDDEEHYLLFSALGNFFGKDQASEFQNISSVGDEFTGRQQTRTNFQEARYTFKLDYAKPFNDEFSIETGAQYVINDVSNDFSVSNLVNEAWVVNPALTNIFEYHQNVLGVYGTGAFEGNRWGIKLGLRLEQTDLSTLLLTTDEGNQQKFWNLFPSGHTSYKFSDFFSLQAGYSRRIFRPRLWDLNPFFNPRNNFSIRTGNPDLLPEFTDSWELTSIYALKKASFNLGVYYRFTDAVVERVSFFEDNVNVVMPINLGTNRATGVEVNGKYNPTKWLGFNGDFNFLVFSRRGTFEGRVFDFDGDQWSGKLTTKLKLPGKIDFEVTGRYESRVKTVQSIISDQLFADLGLRKKILKGRGVFNLSIRDIFASRIRESNTTQPEFFLYSRRLRGRFITLGFSYGFGKGEAMEFSGRKRF